MLWIGCNSSVKSRWKKISAKKTKVKPFKNKYK